MSEGPNITPPERPTSPQERIDQAATSRYSISNDVPIPPFRINDSLSLNNRLVNAAENIALTNSRILTNLDQMKTMFTQFDKDRTRVSQIQNAETQRSQVPGAPPPIYAESLTDTERIRALTRIREVGEFPEGLSVERMNRLRARRLEQLGVGAREGDLLRVGDDRYAGGQLEQAIRRARGETKLPLEDKNLERVAASIEQGAMRSSLESATKATMQERLRARGLETFDFLNPANLMHTIGGMVTGQHGARGIPRIATTVPGSVAEGVGGEAATAGGLAGASGVVERLMAGGGLGGLMARGALGLVPGIGQIAVAAMALPTIARHIPGLNRLLDARQSVIGLETTGALTGEGRGAGLAAFREARDLRGGVIGSQFHGLLHPFDPITNEIANQIVTSVRTQGFTGAQGRQFQQASASLYRDLRLPIDQTTELLTDAVRQGGESLAQITHEMHGFDDAAHQLQMNINEYATAISSTAKTLREGGAGSLATQFAQTLVAALPRSLRTPEGISTVQQGMQQAAPYIMARTGLMPWQLGTAQALPQQFGAYEQTLQQQFAMAQGRTPQEKANYASMYLPAFQGMNPLQVRQLMDRIQHGRGPGSIVALDQARHEYSRQIRRMGGAGTMTGSQILKMGRGEARRLGVTDAEWEQIQNDLDRDRGRDIGRTYRVKGATDTASISGPRLRALRENVISGLGATLTEQQRKELRSHIDDRHFSFDKAIHRYESGRGVLGSGSSVDVNGVTVTLKGKAAKLFDLNAPNREQAYRGLRPMNQAFDTENQRFDTGF